MDADPPTVVNDPVLHCHFCRRTVRRSVAPAAEWVPDWYDAAGVCSDDPACPDCAREFLRVAADGEYEYRHGVPADLA